MMRSMRAIYKPVFVIVATTFIGWLAYGQVTDILGGGRDVVLKVNGQVVRAPQFQAALQSAIEDSRRRGAGRLSREDEQQLQDQVTAQLVQRILLSASTDGSEFRCRTTRSGRWRAAPRRRRSSGKSWKTRPSRPTASSTSRNGSTTSAARPRNSARRSSSSTATISRSASSRST